MYESHTEVEGMDSRLLRPETDSFMNSMSLGKAIFLIGKTGTKDLVV